jgi:hypothetical protein
LLLIPVLQETRDISPRIKPILEATSNNFDFCYERSTAAAGFVWSMFPSSCRHQASKLSDDGTEMEGRFVGHSFTGLLARSRMSALRCIHFRSHLMAAS